MPTAKGPRPPIDCQVCQTHVPKPKAGQKYCSPDCAHIACNERRKRKPLLKLECPYCHNSFEQRTTTQKYCSDFCSRKTVIRQRNILYKEYPPRQCDYCQQEFQPKAYNHRFCKPKCAREFRIEASAAIREKTVRPTKKCEGCRKEFVPVQNRQNFCTTKCRSKSCYTADAPSPIKIQPKKPQPKKMKLIPEQESYSLLEDLAPLPQMVGRTLTSTTTVPEDSAFQEQIKNFIAKGGKIKQIETVLVQPSTNPVRIDFE